MDSNTKSRTPKDLLHAFNQALLHLSPEEFAELFAEDARYEFPFISPGRPPFYRNKKEIYEGFKKAWANAPVRLKSITDVVIYQTTDPSMIIAEQKMNAIVTTSGESFTRAALLIIQSKEGSIVRIRDYADTLSGIKEMGRIDALVKILKG